MVFNNAGISHDVFLIITAIGNELEKSYNIKEGLEV